MSQNSGAEDSAKLMHSAIKGLGTDEEALINEFARSTNAKLQQTKQAYMTLHGRTLEEAVNSDTSGHLCKTLLSLLEPREHYEAKCLRDAIKGLGTNEKCLIQILCPKRAHEIKQLKEEYNKVHSGRDLDADIASEVSGHLGRLLRSLASAGRCEESTKLDEHLAKAEALELFEAGEGKKLLASTDKDVFVRVLCARSFGQLALTFNEYDKLSKKGGIEKAVERELHRDLERACLAIVRSVRDKTGYFARELNETMSGLGTSDSDLIRLIVSRREIDLPQIKDSYQEIYKKSLYYDIGKDTSGCYKQLLLSLI